MIGAKVSKVSGFDMAALQAKVLEKAALATEIAGQTAKESLVRGQLDGPASGREYPSRKGDGSIHIASAPSGEQPHADTEQMIDAIEVDTSRNVGVMPQVSTGWEGEQARIAAAVYDGTADGRIAPRQGMQEAGVKGLAAAREAFESTSGVQQRLTGGDAGYETPL